MRTPYGFQLKIGNLARLFSPGFDEVLAHRDEGGSMRVRVTEFGTLPNAHSQTSDATSFVNLTFNENQTSGTALVYWDRRRGKLSLSSIKTSDLANPSAKFNMSPGAGTIILTWLCALAAQEHLLFEVFHIQNPQILRILMRDLLSPQETLLEYCQNVEDENDEGYEVLGTEHGLTGELQFNRHPGSTFTIVRGKPHDQLLETLRRHSFQ